MEISSQNKRHFSPLVWVFALFMSIRPILTGEALLYNLLPNFWKMLDKLEYISFYTAVPIINNLVYSIFPKEYNKKINDSSRLDVVMNHILDYVRRRYHFPYYSLYTLNRETNTLDFTKNIIPDYVSPEKRKILEKGSYSLDTKDSDSFHFQAIQSKRSSVY